MIVKLNLERGNCIVNRMDSPKIYKDSTLICHIKRELQKQGYDVISKDLSREEGNMVSPGCYGIIARNRDYQIYYDGYLIRDIHKDYNEGELILSIAKSD